MMNIIIIFWLKIKIFNTIAKLKPILKGDRYTFI